MERIYLTFNDLDEGTQEYIIEKAGELISDETKEELKELAESEGYEYSELLRTEAESNIGSIEFVINI